MLPTQRVHIVIGAALCAWSGGCSNHRPSVAAPWEVFSGANALQHVQKLVDFGPRPSGSENLEEARRYIVQQLEQYGWQAERQTFTAPTPRGALEFTNLIGRWKGAPARAGGSVILASHYDTKFYESFPFLGANDAGSSTGALLEIARVLSRSPEVAARVELVFFDGEEAISEFSESDGLYGSRHYAATLKQNGKTGEYAAGIVLDMVGDKNLVITLSPDSPPELARRVFSAAETLGVRRHFTYFSSPILDDHVPLNQAGIPTIDLIDFDYPAWHTAEDTMDKIDAGSLEIVGRVSLFLVTKLLEE